ncbi:hypothetical protein [Paraconexibacter algicola]|uniref:Uncharacterized protein n=1 Tax=Paraconexibacter algicola TaxID=2133960 RepID=A0A2T4UEB1_9ACTN|nr:hypothetical protein [Paraconexibacter algicola]PTL56124.1 hypothetical protein C7Y72_14110 [Paraconexibacter algicola]
MVPSANVLTPGTGGYAVLKLGAVGGLLGLRYLAARRSSAQAREQVASVEPSPTETAGPARSHSVSRRKQQRRRRR